MTAISTTAGRRPACMDEREYQLWGEANAQLRDAGAPSPCSDCSTPFSQAMRAVDRCDGTPGQAAAREDEQLAAFDLAPRPVMRGPATLGGTALGELAVRLYNATAGRPMEPYWPAATTTTLAYLAHVYAAVGDPLEVGRVVPDRAIRPGHPGGPVWVAISGGKDGLATALLLRRAGHQVVGYHLAGINRSYPDEAHYAAAACEALGIPLVVDTCTIRGPAAGFTEMPTKNQVIATMMAHHAIRAGASGLAMGVVQADVPATMNPVRNWSDGTTAVALWAAHLAALAPGLAWHTPLRHETEAVAVLTRAGALHLAHGCMAPLRYRAQLRAANERKYGRLLPGRCGSCPKCCSEHLMLCALAGRTDTTGLWDHCRAYLARMMPDEHPDDPAGDPVAHYVRDDIVQEYRSASQG